MTPVRLEPAAPHSQVKHSTTEALRSLDQACHFLYNVCCNTTNVCKKISLFKTQGEGVGDEGMGNI